MYHVTMMKIKFFLISLILPWFFLSCFTDYGFRIHNESIPQDELNIRIYSDSSLLLVARIINPYYGNQLRNIEFIDGWIKIGDIFYSFKREDINISVDIWYEKLDWFAKDNYHNRFNIVSNFIHSNLIDRMGIRNTNNLNINNSEEEKFRILQSASHFLFFKHLEEKDIKLLYKQKNKNVKIFFEYDLIMENEIINVQVDEDFIYESGKSIINLFNLEGH